MNVPVLHAHSYSGGTLRLATAGPAAGPLVPVTAVAPADGALSIEQDAIPVWRGGNHGEYVALEHIYERLLIAANKRGVASLSIPLVVDASSGFPPDRAVRVVFSTVFRFFREHAGDLREITLVVPDSGAYELAAQVLAIAARTYLGTSNSQN